MMHHGGKTPKPTVCWSNSEEILQALDLASVRSSGHYPGQPPRLNLNHVGNLKCAHTWQCKEI